MKLFLAVSIKSFDDFFIQNRWWLQLIPQRSSRKTEDKTSLKIDWNMSENYRKALGLSKIDVSSIESKNLKNSLKVKKEVNPKDVCLTAALQNNGILRKLFNVFFVYSFLLQMFSSFSFHYNRLFLHVKLFPLIGLKYS